jgi:pSer/pThr/pTyr-binding forkhead associated (FHA) protein
MRTHVASDRGEYTMNYVLQVVRGRSVSTTLKLADGVTSIGRHDDCLIRIKSAQVSRRHCEVFEVSDKLTIRDLGSSNGTFVNGKKVAGQQALKAGDELTVGAVTLRVAKLGQSAQPQPASPISKPKAADTAELEAIAALPDEEHEEFEMEFDDGDPEPEVEGIPLVDEETKKPVKPKSSPKIAAAAETPTVDQANTSPKPSAPKEDDAIAQFLLDLKLDDEE